MCPAGWILTRKEGRKGTALQAHLRASSLVTSTRKFKEFGSKCFSEAENLLFQEISDISQPALNHTDCKGGGKTQKQQIPHFATGSKILADTFEPLLTPGPVNVLLRADLTVGKPILLLFQAS